MTSTELRYPSKLDSQVSSDCHANAGEAGVVISITVRPPGSQYPRSPAVIAYVLLPDEKTALEYAPPRWSYFVSVFGSVSTSVPCPMKDTCAGAVGSVMSTNCNPEPRELASGTGSFVTKLKPQAPPMPPGEVTSMYFLLSPVTENGSMCVGLTSPHSPALPWSLLRCSQTMSISS